MTTQQQNARGEWIPAIPEPLFVGWRLRHCRCDCGQTFPDRVTYQGHYALVHILAVKPMTEPASAARQRDVYRVIQDACFGAGWLTTGVILGAAGGWWALLSGPVFVAVVIMGGARYAKR